MFDKVTHAMGLLLTLLGAGIGFALGGWLGFELTYVLQRELMLPDSLGTGLILTLVVLACSLAGMGLLGIVIAWLARPL